MPRIQWAQAGRAVLRSRFTSALAVAAFTVGIGVTTAVFSIFYGVLLRPLPFPEEDRLVRVYDTQPACATCPASYPKYLDWRDRSHVFEALAGANPAAMVLTGSGDPERLRITQATASLVDVLKVKPSMGRWFSVAEDRPGAAKVVVLSNRFWMSRLAADPRVLGQSLVLDGEPHEVIGVVPDAFDLRDPAAPTSVYVPLARAADPQTRGNHFLPVYGRLKAGVTVEQAAVEMRALGEHLAREFGTNHGVDLQSYRESVVGAVRGPLRVLMGAVMVVLLIACANVCNLLLASTVARRGEFAIRRALGADQRDIALQLAAEGILLSGAGGAGGALLAIALVRGFVTLAHGQLPGLSAIGIDGRVLLLTAAIAAATGVLCGLWPIVWLRSDRLAAAIAEGSARTKTAAGGRLISGLVVGEIALAFALLVGGGILVKNLLRLSQRDPGFRSDGVLAFDVAPSGPRYAPTEARTAFYAALQERISSAPGVRRAALISHLPMSRWGTNGEMSVEGGNPWPPDAAPLVEYRWYLGEYFDALGIPLLRGRMLDHGDGAGTTTVLVNQAMADKFWPGQDPIGKRFGQPDSSSPPQWYQVVGVVGNVRAAGLTAAPLFEFYRTLEQAPFDSSVTAVVRADGSADPTSLVPTLRQVVRGVDATVPIANIRTLDEVQSDSLGRPRLMSALLAAFATLAGLLAVVGVYGVMAYNVRRQRQEVGIRMALGADARRIRNLVLGRGAFLAAAGVSLGLVGAFLLTHALGALLYDVSATDPAVFVTTATVLAAAILSACYPSARAASRVEPNTVLRHS